MKFVSDLLGGHTFDCGRVTTFLGANGVGKSRLLKEIKDSPKKLEGAGKIVYIEGGRTIKIDNQLKLTLQTFQHYDRLETSEAQWNKKATSSLADRVLDGLFVLHQRGVVNNAAFANLVEEWRKGGQIGPCPRRQQPPLDKVFELFQQIFPAISLSFDESKRALSASKNGVTYGLASLSDGEKQVFSVLADLMDLKDGFKYVVVDEPELNLHPSLAEALWTLVEDEFPEMSFVYATHSINFAMRKSVDTLFVLSNDVDHIVRIDHVSQIPRDEMASFLGGLPGILSANRVLITEGHEKSFDVMMYRWLMDDDALEILPAGDCNQVLKIAAKQDLWHKVASGISIVGIVDSDFSGAGDVVRSDAVYVLPFHEAESLLCMPELVVQVAEKLGFSSGDFTIKSVAKTILDELDKQRLQIAAKRVIASSKIGLGVSIQRSVISKLATPEELTKCILEAGDSEVAKAVEVFGADNLQSKLHSELAHISNVIATCNIEAALLLIPGKELAHKLAKSLGLQHAEALVKFLKGSFQVDQFDHLKLVRSEISSRLNGRKAP